MLSTRGRLLFLFRINDVVSGLFRQWSGCVGGTSWRFINCRLLSALLEGSSPSERDGGKAGSISTFMWSPYLSAPFPGLPLTFVLPAFSYLNWGRELGQSTDDSAFWTVNSSLGLVPGCKDELHIFILWPCMCCGYRRKVNRNYSV